MSLARGLYWLPDTPNWLEQLKALEKAQPPANLATWEALRVLANSNLDFLKTERLNHLVKKLFQVQPEGLQTAPVKLAILSTCTTGHLEASIRIAALRKNIWLTLYSAPYGQLQHELLDPSTGIWAFKPNVVLISLDGHHVAANAAALLADMNVAAAEEACIGDICSLWQIITEKLGATVLQQTIVPSGLPVLGNNEHQSAQSKLAFIHRVNYRLREEATKHSVNILAVDYMAARIGLDYWHDPIVWNKAKMDTVQAVAPLYGDLVGRTLAAMRGKSAKCLVLDLDNTLWGGVIGDDGMDGIVLGQGSTAGEAYTALQAYALELAQRGVLLAVCSKNTEHIAKEVFEKHPEMLIRMKNISCFMANWEDKASNIQKIAATLNIGIDSIAFLDDNPFERNQVRGALPSVMVLEYPEDEPAFAPRMLADSGVFETLGITRDDLARNAQYADNNKRAELESSAKDLDSYLKSLDMRLYWSEFNKLGLARTVQLINKTNQFNLTTRRYTEVEVTTLMADSAYIALQFRLIDKIGDNGMISVIIGKQTDQTLHIECWLMSCRVLNRGVEMASLDMLAAECSKRNIHKIIGEYIPTDRNGIVEKHYENCGFSLLPSSTETNKLYELNLDSRKAGKSFITTVFGDPS